MISRTFLALTTVLVSASVGAQQNDITFFVIGKHSNYQQDERGQVSPVDYSFFAEIFLTGDGDASDASLTYPTGEVVPFEDMRGAEGGSRDNIFLISGADRFTDLAALQDRYPDGTYKVSFDTPSGDVDDELVFQPRSLPQAPVISVSQGGLENCLHLEPGEDATVHWRPFADGRADPNGILDDLIFVILTDSDGIRVSHSGRPFEERPHLTYATDSHTIDGDVLKPGQTYTLSVEHALLDDTTRFDGVPAFTTRAVTTKLTLTTASAAPPSGGCGAPVVRKIPTLDSSVTMFYYKDITAAADFYGNILGLETTFDWDWVKFYKTGPGSNVGIVQESDGAWHEVQEKNAVMLSLVTSEVDAWYARLKDRDDVTVLKPIGDGGGIRSFLLEDPGGYTVEFFQWLDPE